jgi:hypothetical protein
MTAPRLYGTADPDSDRPPTEQGLGGERVGPTSPSAPPRSFIGADGSAIAAQDTSGTAAAKAVGDLPADDSDDDRPDHGARRKGNGDA